MWPDTDYEDAHGMYYVGDGPTIDPARQAEARRERRARATHARREALFAEQGRRLAERLDRSKPQRKETPVSVSEASKKIDELKAYLAELEAAARVPARFETEPPRGTVLRVQKTFSTGGIAYSYAFLRAPNGLWYGSDADGGRRTWAQLVEFIGNAPCDVAEAWVAVPAVPEPVEPSLPDWINEMKNKRASQARTQRLAAQALGDF